MKQSISILAGLFFLFLTQLSFAQQPTGVMSGSTEKFQKSIFVEGFGNGILISANYDMRLKRGRRDGLGVRGGIGGGSLEGTSTNGDYVDFSMVTFPLGVNYLVGRRRSFFEAGVGVTPIYVNADALLIDGDFYSGTGWGVTGFLNVGYRFQPIRNGVMFRLDWTPAFNAAGFSGGFFGASLGFSFK